MKTLCIALFALVSTATTGLKQNTETIAATYVGYENEVYNFMDSDSNAIEFQNLKAEAKEKYDLDGDDFKGKSFKITYETVITDETSEEEVTTKTITDLELLEAH
tara:strand:- start:2464 stop:2778 length:315 start_codon:yes stop_codon:yes gene_type:complete